MSVDRTDSGVSLGVVLGIILALLVALAILWFAVGPGLGGAPADQGSNNNSPTINVNPPAPVNPGTNPGGGTGTNPGGGTKP